MAVLGRLQGSRGAFCQGMLGLHNCLPTNGFSMKPLKGRLLAEQKATEESICLFVRSFTFSLILSSSHSVRDVLANL